MQALLIPHAGHNVEICVNEDTVSIVCNTCVDVIVSYPKEPIVAEPSNDELQGLMSELKKHMESDDPAIVLPAWAGGDKT